MVGVYTKPLRIYDLYTSTRPFRWTTLYMVRLHHPLETTMRYPQIVYLNKCACFCFWVMSIVLCSSAAPASGNGRLGRKGKGTSAGRRWEMFQTIDRQMSAHPKYHKYRLQLSTSAVAAAVLLLAVVHVLLRSVFIVDYSFEYPQCWNELKWVSRQKSNSLNKIKSIYYRQ